MNTKMDLRDEFAMEAMRTVLPYLLKNMQFDLIGNVGSMSYRIADDMLKERSKGPSDREP